jgi:hypothetical protein
MAQTGPFQAIYPVFGEVDWLVEITQQCGCQNQQGVESRRPLTDSGQQAIGASQTGKSPLVDGERCRHQPG